MPRPEVGNRVIANDLPAKTYSPTSFDLPQRKDVLQSQMPTMITRTIETKTDPRFPPKRPVTTVHGVLYHGTASTDPKVVHGIETNFLQKTDNYKLKKTNEKKSEKDFDLKNAQVAKVDGLNAAKAAFENSSAVLDSITRNIAPSPQMVIDAKVINKKEFPDLKIHEQNHSLERRMEELKKTPAGVRALHTPRKIY